MKTSLFVSTSILALALLTVPFSLNAQSNTQDELAKIQQQLDKAKKIMQQQGASPQQVERIQQMMRETAAGADDTAGKGLDADSMSKTSPTPLNPATITAQIAPQLPGWQILEEKFYNDPTLASHETEDTFPLYNISLRNAQTPTLTNLENLKTFSVGIHKYNNTAFEKLYKREIETLAASISESITIKPRFDSATDFFTALESNGHSVDVSVSSYKAYFIDDFFNFSYDINPLHSSMPQSPAAMAFLNMSAKALVLVNEDKLVASFVFASPGSLPDTTEAQLTKIANELDYTIIEQEFGL